MPSRRPLSPFTLIVAFVCLSLTGLALIPLLPVKLNPQRTLPGFSITYRMPGASSRVVEREVTVMLESMLSRIRGIKELGSVSANGSGTITVELDKHADADAARFEAATIIRQTWPRMPQGVTYPVIEMHLPDEEAARPFLTFTLNASSTPFLIQQYAEEHIKPRLSALPGVYKVEVSGATPLEWRLVYDSRQLQRLQVTVEDIREAISRHYGRQFLGIRQVDDGTSGQSRMRVALVGAGEEGTFDPRTIPVTAVGGKTLYLDELVTATLTEAPAQSYYRINGLNSIYLSVTAAASANQLRLGKAVKRQIAAMGETLPPGYEIHTTYDATGYINQELHKIYRRTGLTVLVLLLFVWFLTRKPGYLWLIVTSLAVNITVAVIFYYLCHLELQLYSLAGITVSLNLIIDSTIVIADHLLHRHNLKAYLSVLAATLTTMGALAIIFFLNEEIRLNLQDFAAVVIINLAVSLLVSLFFVPAMVEKLHLAVQAGKARPRHRLAASGKRFSVRFSHAYARLIRLSCRHRLACFAVAALLFGLPVFLLPDKAAGHGSWARLYNRTLGSDTYKESVKPVVDKVLGGTLRLFVQKVYAGSYFSRNEEVVLSAEANLPDGSTLEQMDALVKRMEHYLSGYKEIRQFQTAVYDARSATIDIYFKEAYRHGSFPYLLKNKLVNQALRLGGGSWYIYGLPDQGFSNDVRESAGSYRITLAGYNYDELYALARRLEERLLKHRRIKEVTINSRFTWWKDDYREYYLDLDRQGMAKAGIDAGTLLSAMDPLLGRDIEAGTLPTPSGARKIMLSSMQSADYDLWALENMPFTTDSAKQYKLSQVAAIDKRQTPQEIVKQDRQYQLCLQYEYIGSRGMGDKLLKQDVEAFNRELPMGYTARGEDTYQRWSSRENRQYLLLGVVVAIIFFLTGILFNSLKQPFAIIFIIPVSYIGVFLTFYRFHLNFDQGGFASFVLLCGITVNAGIYILNEYNDIRRRFPRLSAVRAYVKAWNAKVVPIFLTVVSTILGFLPFMTGSYKEPFWFPLAAGTIGGLVMSLAGIFLFLPLLTVRGREAMR